MSDVTLTEVERVLAEHGLRGQGWCKCGTSFYAADEYGLADHFRRHLAEIVEAIVAARVAEAEAKALAEVAALADKWERDNRRPKSAADQVLAGVWSATKADVAELRAVLRAALRAEGGGDRD